MPYISESKYAEMLSLIIKKEKEIDRLREELQDILDYARTEGAPLREQEMKSIEDAIFDKFIIPPAS